MNENQQLNCQLLHSEFHQKYYECVGDYGGYIGECWEHGIRCSRCGNTFPDPEEVARQEKEYRIKRSKQYHCKFGTTDKQIMSFGGQWQDLERFHTDYQIVRDIYLRKKEDIGPIEDKFFVFHNDCQALDPPVPNPNMPFTDEWNLLSNCPGLKYPMSPEAAEVWNKRKLTYSQAVDKVKNTVRDESYLK